MRSARTRAGSSSTIRTLVRATGAGGAGAGGAAGADAGWPAACSGWPATCSRPLTIAAPLTRRSDGVPFIERDVQQEHVDARLAQEAQRAALGVLADQRPDRGRADVPGRRHPADLD